MTTYQDTDRVTKFRSPSKEDFSQYARNFSWLIEESLQKSQELLARIYGYSNLHELLINLQKPGTPGPYDHDWVFRIIDKDPSIPIVDEAARHNGILEILSKHKGVDIIDLGPRYWDAREIGLFDTPVTHRKEFKRIRFKYDVLGSSEPDGLKLLVSDYANIDYQNDQAIPEFTALGRGVFDAVTKLLPDDNSVTSDDQDRAKSEILKIIQRHPNNPWPCAMFVCAFGQLRFQGPWNDIWDSQKRPSDASPQFMRYAPDYAHYLLPFAQRAVTLFSELYGKHQLDSADYDTTSIASEFGGDLFYWPAVLYWGGMVALNSNQPKLAYTWLSKNYKICKRDSFNASQYLAILRLLRGKASVRALFHLTGPQQTTAAWDYMAVAASDYAEGNLKGAASMFAEALTQSFAAAEPFAGRDNRIASIRMISNINIPATVQEFMYRTDDFWKQHPDATAFFSKIAKDSTLKGLLRDYWYNQESLTGILLRSTYPEMYKLEAEERALKAKLRDAVMAAAGQSKVG